MSESKEKKSIQPDEEKTLTKKEAAALKQKKQSKKNRRTVILIVVIVIVLLLVALFINSKFIRRNFNALTVGDSKYSAAEFEFYYFEMYYDYVQFVYENQYDNAGILLPNVNEPLEAQDYYGEGTWKDYFQEYAIGNLTRYEGLYKEAKNVGFEMDEEAKAALQKKLDEFPSTASAYGFTDVNKYLQQYYGEAANMEIAEKCCTYLAYCDAYDEYYKETRTYPDEDIKAEYENRKERYDNYDFRYMMVAAENVNDHDYESEEAAAEVRAEKVAVSHAQAEEIMAGIKSEEDYIKAAREYDGEKYAEDDSTYRNYNGDILGSVYGPWLRDEARVEGDMEVFDIRTGTYLVYFINRTENKYATVNAKTITVTPDEVLKESYADEEDDTAYNAAVEEAKNDAYAEIENIKNEWLENGATEEAFDQLIEDNKYTSMVASADVENIHHTQFSEEIDAWLFDEARKEGDYLETYSENAGCYYLVYYKGTDMLYNEYLAKQELQRLEELDHENSLTAGVEYKKHWTFALA